MKYIIAVYLWGIGLIYFGLACIFVLFISLFLPPHTYDPWIKGMLKLLFKILFIRIESEGAEKVHQGDTYIFMSNHVSIFDVPLLAAYIPTFVRGVQAKHQFSWPFYGWVIRRLGNIPIDRENIHTSIQSMGEAEKYLKDGKSMVILPEGHRTLDGKLRPFKKLPFFFAKQVKVNIIPIGLSGLFHLKRKGSWLIQPTTVKIKFGDIISAETVESLSVVELREVVREEIQNLIEKP